MKKANNVKINLDESYANDFELEQIKVESKNNKSVNNIKEYKKK